MQFQNLSKYIDSQCFNKYSLIVHLNLEKNITFELISEHMCYPAVCKGICNYVGLGIFNIILFVYYLFFIICLLFVYLSGQLYTTTTNNDNNNYTLAYTGAYAKTLEAVVTVSCVYA